DASSVLVFCVGVLCWCFLLVSSAVSSRRTSGSPSLADTSLADTWQIRRWARTGRLGVCCCHFHRDPCLSSPLSLSQKSHEVRRSNPNPIGESEKTRDSPEHAQSEFRSLGAGAGDRNSSKVGEGLLLVHVRLHYCIDVVCVTSSAVICCHLLSSA